MTFQKSHTLLWLLAAAVFFSFGPAVRAAQAADGPQAIGQLAEAPGEGSKGYSHGSPHGEAPHGAPHGESPHGKMEGSGSKSGHGGYAHGGGHSYKGHDSAHHGKPGGSHGVHGQSGHGAPAGFSRGHGGKNPFKHVLCFAEKLGLTDEQVATIKEKKFEFAKRHIQFEADHTLAHMDLEHLVHSGNLDEAAMRAVGDRLVQIKTAKIKAMVEAKITLLKILTEEQRQKIAAIHAKRGK